MSAGEAEAPLFPRWMLATAGVFAVGAVVYALRGVLTPIFFAFLIAYMLDPVVDRLEAWKLPRAAGISVLLVLVLGALTLFLLLVAPGIISDVAEFAKELPAKARRTLEAWEPVLASWDIPVPHSLDDVLEQVSTDAQGLAQQAIAPTTAALGAIVGGTANVVGAIVGLVMIPVFAFYLLYDFDRMMAALKELVPPRHRGSVVDVFGEVDEVLGQFIRGQLLVMMILAALYATGYAIMGVRLAIPIGIVAGLLSFIPYVGGATALGLALGMCAFDYQGIGQLGGVIAVYGVVQLLEGFVITPKIVGDKVGLSSVWVLFALMVGGEVFGFLGVLLAVPAAAVAKIFVRRGVETYRESRLFLGDGTDEDVAGERGGASAEAPAESPAEARARAHQEEAPAEAPARAEAKAEAPAQPPARAEAPAKPPAQAEAPTKPPAQAEAPAGADGPAPAHQAEASARAEALDARADHVEAGTEARAPSEAEAGAVADGARADADAEAEASLGLVHGRPLGAGG